MSWVGAHRPRETVAEHAPKKTEAELQAEQEAANKEQQDLLKAALGKLTVSPSPCPERVALRTSPLKFSRY
jgi:hypothetical protein